MFIHPSANRIYFLVFKKTAFFEMKIEKIPYQLDE